MEVLDITPLKNSFSEGINISSYPSHFVGALRFDIRKAPSIDKNGRNQYDSDVNYNEATMNGTQVYTQEDLDNGIIDDPALIGYSYGMGWFPGYAIDIETGERLNIMFGEDSKLIGCNGRDMLWNPTSDIMTDLYRSTNGAQGEVLFGGKHYIYIMGNNIRKNILGSAKWESFPSYDGGKKIKDYLDEAANESAANRRKIIRRVFRNAMWVSIPLHNSEYEFLSTDVTIKLRVANPYYKNLIHFTKEQYENLSQDKDSLQSIEDALSPNYNYPMYSFSTKDLSTTKNDNVTAEDALDIIKIVPNPYYGYCAYEKEQIENLVKFTNLPQNCTISIYTVSGTLVKRFKKDNPLTFVEWDLKNTYGIAIASGVYIIHIEAPGIGEKILKWFGALRPIDLQTF